MGSLDLKLCRISFENCLQITFYARKFYVVNLKISRIHKTKRQNCEKLCSVMLLSIIPGLIRQNI